MLDGGELLHRVPWQPGLTFHELCQLYVDYIKKRYQHVTIVFEGYDSGPTIKDATHRRRTAGNSDLDPDEYGWKLSDKCLLPVMTDKEPIYMQI